MIENYKSFVDVEKNTVYKTVEEVLNPEKLNINVPELMEEELKSDPKGRRYMRKPDEVVDTPTPLAAGTENKVAGVGVIVVVGIAIWYFFLRRK